MDYKNQVNLLQYRGGKLRFIWREMFVFSGPKLGKYLCIGHG